MLSLRKPAVAAVVAAAALALAACGSSGGTATTSSNGHVTLTWWTNATTGQLKTVWQQAAAAFHKAHPNVTIQVVPIQNEAFTTKVPAALASSNPPDIYQQWGGGQEASQVPSGKLTNLSPYVSGWIGQIGAAAQGWQVNGKQYGVPYDLHTVGFWYRKDLFAKAGISKPPATMPELDADVTKLKARAHRADRGGQQGQVAGRVLVGVLRHPGVPDGHPQVVDARRSTCPTPASARRART